MNEKIFDLNISTRKDKTITEIEKGKENESLNSTTIFINAKQAEDIFDATQIKDLKEQDKALKEIFKKIVDVNGKVYSYDIEDVYTFTFNRRINKE